MMNRSNNIQINNKKIRSFFIIERIMLIINLAFFISIVIEIIIAAILYKNYRDSDIIKIIEKMIFISLFLTILIGLINFARPRRCPICKKPLRKYTHIDGQITNNRCEKCNFEVDSFFIKSSGL